MDVCFYIYNTLINIINACKTHSKLFDFSGHWANKCLNMRVPGLKCMASGVEHLESKEQKGKFNLKTSEI